MGVTAGTAKTCLPDLQMVPASCVSVRERGRKRETKGSSQPFTPYKSPDPSGLRCDFYNLPLASLRLCTAMLEIRASGWECWERHVSAEQKVRALESHCQSWKELGSSCLLSLSLFLSSLKTEENFQFILKVKILFAAFLCWISKLRGAVVFRMVYIFTNSTVNVRDY